MWHCGATTNILIEGSLKRKVYERNLDRFRLSYAHFKAMTIFSSASQRSMIHAYVMGLKQSDTCR